MDANKKITDNFNRAQDRLVLQSSDLSLETIAAMVNKGSIDASPVFQRRERWSPERQSALIESFLLNVPVPPVYLSEDDFGTYSVIDGKQRITAIREFMDNELALTSLEAFPEISLLRFRELPRALQNALQVRPYLRVVTLLKQSDPVLKYEVFTRLNRGGEPLNAQEIRNVAFRGPLNDLIYKLGDDDFLKRQLKIRNEKSPPFREMADAEYVLRFFALQAVWRKFAGSFRRTMDDFMSVNQNAEKRDIERFRRQFQRSIRACEDFWGSNAFMRCEHGTWRQQMLAGMYDSQMLAVAELSDTQIATLRQSSKEIVRRTRVLFAQDDEFEESVRRGTNTPSKIRYRVQKMRDLLEAVAGE